MKHIQLFESFDKSNSIFSAQYWLDRLKGDLKQDGSTLFQLADIWDREGWENEQARLQQELEPDQLRAIQALKGKLAYANPWKSWEGLTFYFQPKFDYREGIQPKPVQIFPGSGYGPNWKPDLTDLLDGWEDEVMSALPLDTREDYENWFEEFVASVPIFNHTFTINYNPTLTNFETIFEDFELSDSVHHIELQDIVNYLKDQEGVIDVIIN
ncbi:hypothetical protein EBS02_06435 [bacterium]|nr:hypothetical protein [bacterium]